MCLLDDTLDKDWLAQRFLVGVNLFNPQTGEAFPSALFNHAIRQGREQTEGEFDVSFCMTDVEDEQHDLSDVAITSQYLTNLRTKPLISVTRLAEYGPGNRHIRDLPPEWVVYCSKKLSQVQVQNDGEHQPERAQVTAYGGGYRGSAFRWYYKAGFAEVEVGTASALKDSIKVTGAATTWRGTLKLGDIIGFPGSEGRTVTRVLSNTLVEVDRPWSYAHTAETMSMVRVPSILLEYAGIVAAKEVLTTAGDLVIGAGISSMSRSQDGQSQSIQTTASPENNAYSARMRAMDEQLEDLWRRTVRDWRPMEVFVLGGEQMR